MKIFFLNLKKCSTLSLFLWAGLALPQAQGAPSPSVQTIRRDLASRSSTDFDPLLKKWNRQYGSRAVQTLLRIASDPQSSDADRYVALMGAAKLGGPSAAPLMTHYLKDKNWMIRSATLRALGALGHPQTAAAVLPLLNDPALVVRTEAVVAVEKLRPKGASRALARTVVDEKNYHHGRALWVPQKALRALARMESNSDTAALLLPALDFKKDPQIQKLTIATLEQMTGKKSKSRGLSQKIREWKRNLASTH